MQIKNISLIGCGALGIMYASHLIKSLPQAKVQFIADKQRIDRYKNTEFYSNGERRSFDFVSPDMSEQPADLLIFAVKYPQLGDAIQTVRNFVGENTIILSVLNGISSEEIIGRTYNPAKIINCMVAGMDATRTGNAVNFTKMGYVAFGRLEHNDPLDIETLAVFFSQAQIWYEIEKDITKAIWWKYMLNIGVNQTSALLGATYGLFHTSPHAQAIMAMAMSEAYDISQKLNIGLREDDIDKATELVKSLSAEGKTSMLQDIEAKRPTEIDMFAGMLIELGEKHNVPVPVNTFLFNAIKAIESRY